jgi:hypothetical protein
MGIAWRTLARPSWALFAFRAGAAGCFALLVGVGLALLLPQLTRVSARYAARVTESLCRIFFAALF